ncbi:type VI secretion system TssO [Spirosoma flavum]|uniref:Type VI secretion system TssO n=1 Tax=Spirosoma flavum TaxID=2048557 RepID=A0ABW6AHI6_9BACT
MKSLNHKEISQAFNRFMAWFASLLLVTITCVYSYVKTSSNQLSRLSQQKEAFDQIFLRDAMLTDKVDSLYNYMSLLNTDRIRDDRQMQRLITKKKEEFTKLVTQQQKTQRYFVVYNRLFSHINEMLLMKDSLNKAMVEEGDLRDELKDCLRRAVEEHRQRKRSGGAGAF